MTLELSHLLAEALRLPEKERADLATQLIDSLDTTVDDGAEAAWGVEIQQRLEEVQSGQVKPISWSEARRLILEETDEPTEP